MFSMEKTAAWGDCDAAGIVFYPNYFRWMDEAFHAFTRSVGFDQTTLPADHGVDATPLIDVGCRFRAPLRLYQSFRVVLRVTQLGNSSMTLAYAFDSQGDGIAEGREVRGFVVDGEDGLSKTGIPPAIRALLEAHIE